MLYPPMLPLIAHDSTFVYCSDVELAKYRTNEALVSQLLDSLRCWLSYLQEEVLEASDRILEGFDRADTLHAHRDVLPRCRDMEVRLSFHVHFDRKEVVACVHLLKGVPAATGLLEKLTQQLAVTKVRHEQVLVVLDHMQTLACFMESPQWKVEDIADTLPPLFTSLRALWVCTDMFGAANAPRVTKLMVCVVRLVEEAVHDAGAHVVDELMAGVPQLLVGRIKERLVHAQDATVTLQETFYNLKEQLVGTFGMVDPSVQSSSSTAGTSPHPPPPEIFADIDDEALFSLAEWQYQRLTGLVHVLDLLAEDWDKLGSVLTDPFSGGNDVDLMHPDRMPQPVFLKHLRRIEKESAPNAEEITARIDQKNKVDPFAQRKLARRASSGGGGSSGENNNAATAVASAVPRTPFEKLTHHMIVTCEFNPPVITITGGPLSNSFVDTVQYMLPQCCSNTQVRSFAKERPQMGADPMFVAVSPTTIQMRMDALFCDDEVHVSHILATLMDLIEEENAWKMMDSNAQLIVSGSGQKVLHTLFFRKHRSKKEDPFVATMPVVSRIEDLGLEEGEGVVEVSEVRDEDETRSTIPAGLTLSLN